MKKNILHLIEETPEITYIQRDNDPYVEYWKEYAEEERRSKQAFLFIVLLVAFIWSLFALALWCII